MKTVFIAGVFDCLHQGHINILKRAKALGDLGDRLIIGLNSDEYIREKKGYDRPIDTLEVRRKKLYETQLVDWIIDIEDSPLEAILNWEPDIIVVGDDYTKETTVGYPQCLEWGGEVVVLPRTPDISTTQLIEKKKVL